MQVNSADVAPGTDLHPAFPAWLRHPNLQAAWLQNRPAAPVLSTFCLTFVSSSSLLPTLSSQAQCWGEFLCDGIFMHCHGYFLRTHPQKQKIWAKMYAKYIKAFGVCSQIARDVFNPHSCLLCTRVPISIASSMIVTLFFKYNIKQDLDELVSCLNLLSLVTKLKKVKTVPMTLSQSTTTVILLYLFLQYLSLCAYIKLYAAPLFNPKKISSPLPPTFS